jgi:hypothetical protein
MYFASAVALMLGVSGCPVTDDYYLLPADIKAGASSAGSLTNAGTNAGGSSGQAGRNAGGTGSGTAGAAVGGGVFEPCVPATERCNGHDDDCDESIDEFVCKTDCSGFVLATDPDRGYMFCSGAQKLSYDNAKKACEDQDMRLAWLTTADENGAVAQRLDSLSSDAEVLFGATDQGNEGDWIWAGGQQFWKGEDDGNAVAGLYSNWTDGAPSNTNNEDCALVNAASGKWGDRSCSATYPFVCEQPD